MANDHTHVRLDVVAAETKCALVSDWITQEDFMRSAEREMDKERQAAERKGEVGSGGNDEHEDETA
eukprot:COSAG02_NODE_32111_length_522_cov_0.758865_1_plen_66_part_00